MHCAGPSDGTQKIAKQTRGDGHFTVRNPLLQVPLQERLQVQGSEPHARTT